MKSHRSTRKVLLAVISAPLRAASVVLLLTVSCVDQGGPSDFTLESVWPNDDGRFWIYEGLQQNWEPEPWHAGYEPDRVYPTQEQVPPVPSFEVATRMLRAEIPGEPLASISFGYGLQFSGLAFTRPDATAQNLVESFTIPAVEMAESTNPLLLRLASARPDLRPILSTGRFELEAPRPLAPLLLHGGGWERREDWIGTYGDLYLDLAWKYLEANLARGHRFKFQLVKTLAPDVFLHAKVVGTPRIPVGIDDSQLALEVVYIIDYGISEAVTSGGETVHYFRVYSLGRLLYVPKIGPVQCEERGVYFTGEASPERPVMTQTLLLRETGRDIPPERNLRSRP